MLVGDYFNGPLRQSQPGPRLPGRNPEKSGRAGAAKAMKMGKRSSTFRCVLNADQQNQWPGSRHRQNPLPSWSFSSSSSPRPYRRPPSLSPSRITGPCSPSPTPSPCAWPTSAGRAATSLATDVLQQWPTGWSAGWVWDSGA